MLQPLAHDSDGEEATPIIFGQRATASGFERGHCFVSRLAALASIMIPGPAAILAPTPIPKPHPKNATDDLGKSWEEEPYN